jgi:hypothetical protein
VEERQRILLGLSPPAERVIERLLFDEHAPLQLVASALDGAELERLATEHGPDAALVSPDLPGLTGALCARLRASGCRLAGLAVDAASASALSAFGVDAVVDGGVGIEELREALTPASHDREPSVETRSGRGGRVQERREETGSVLAVVGSRGAPGASECAASVAALAHQRWPTALVECDLLGGGLDLRLAADAHDGSLLGLVRACAAGDGALGELLERWLVRRPGWPPVLLAPPEPWEPLDEIAQPGAIASALRGLALAFPLVVCDVGFLLEEGGDATALARCHREVLTCASAVLLVIGARDRQVRDGLAQLDLLRVELEIPNERLRIVCTGLGGAGSAAPRLLTGMLVERLAERGLALDATLPFDARTLRRAERQGCPLALARRRGAYARATARLLDQLFLPTTVAKPRQRKVRLPQPTLPLPQRRELSLPWRPR